MPRIQLVQLAIDQKWMKFTNVSPSPLGPIFIGPLEFDGENWFVPHKVALLPYGKDPGGSIMAYQQELSLLHVHEPHFSLVLLSWNVERAEAFCEKF